jgi:integrase/recombinase XerD
MISASAYGLKPSHAALIDGFMKDCKLRKITTFQYYCQSAASFLQWTEKRDIDPLKIGKKELKEYLYYLTEDTGLIHKTLESRFARLNAFYDYLEEEELIDQNPIPPFRKRNLRAYKADSESQQRRIISVADAAMLVSSVLETRDRAILLLLLKTGIRCHELCELDVSDVNLKELMITVKPTPKRSNCELYIDIECAETLGRWLNVRSTRNGATGPALFVTTQGNRITSNQVQTMVKKHAVRMGLHDPDSIKLKDHFTPHCCRHFFTTCLIEAGMPRDLVKELRGDARRDAVDVYNHINKKMLRESYLAHIPQLGI